MKTLCSTRTGDVGRGGGGGLREEQSSQQEGGTEIENSAAVKVALFLV